MKTTNAVAGMVLIAIIGLFWVCVLGVKNAQLTQQLYDKQSTVDKLTYDYIDLSSRFIQKDSDLHVCLNDKDMFIDWLNGGK